MKNKKGFTLIELLVTIALMLSILGIAIVSFINVSNRKKEESWQRVKNETEVAAEEYFNTNGYLIEGNKNAKVSIGKLVAESYLNIVTNPVTGKKVNKCDYVEVVYGDDGYSYKYIESKDNVCPSDNFAVTEEVGAPSILVELDKNNKSGTNNWFIGDVKVNATVKTNNNGSIISVKYCTGINQCNNYSDLSLTSNNKYSVTNHKISSNKNGIDGNNVTTKFVATNSAFKTVTAWVTYNKDTVAPSCTYSIDKKPSSTGWYNTETGAPTVTFKGTDELSGINGNDKVTPTILTGNKEYTHTFKDKAGNESQKCSVMVKYDNEKPTCNLSLTGTKGNVVSKLQWYKSDVKINLAVEDKISGTALKGLDTSINSTNGKTSATQSNETKKVTWYGYVKDKAGNTNSCSKTFALEKKVTLSFDATSTNKEKSYNPDGDSNGELVFDVSKGACGFDTCSNIKCKTNSSKTTTCPKYYFARSCKYVNTYNRNFKVSGMSVGDNVSVKVDGKSDSNGIKRSDTLSRYGSDNNFKENYYYAKVGDKSGGRVSFTAHEYQYTSPAGNKSNAIRLYVEYVAKCGYSYY